MQTFLILSRNSQSKGRRSVFVADEVKLVYLMVHVCVWNIEHHFCCLHASSLGSLFYQVAITGAHAWESSQFNLAMLI